MRTLSRGSKGPGPFKFSSVCPLGWGDLSIPLYVAPSRATEQERASYQVGQADGLKGALAHWLGSSQQVRVTFNDLLASTSGHENKV